MSLRSRLKWRAIWTALRLVSWWKARRVRKARMLARFIALELAREEVRAQANARN